MSVQRGSTSQIAAIKETTPNTTPATPTLIQLPVTSFQPKVNNNVIKSAQIRGTPFTDGLSRLRLSYDISIEHELQGANHDMLVETAFGASISSKTLAYTDALKTLTIEETVAAGNFNVFTSVAFSQMSASFSASDNAPIKVQYSGLAIASVLDATTTIATAVTPAAAGQSWVFTGATLTLGGTPTAASSGSFQITRTIDPLYLLGAAVARELVPGEVAATGTLTLPYDASGSAAGATISAAITNFTDEAIVFKSTDLAGTTYRQWTFPKANFSSLDRPLSSRGMRMQTVNWEAKYDTGTTSFCTMATQ